MPVEWNNRECKKEKREAIKGEANEGWARKSKEAQDMTTTGKVMS